MAGNRLVERLARMKGGQPDKVKPPIDAGLQDGGGHAGSKGTPVPEPAKAPTPAPSVEAHVDEAPLVAEPTEPVAAEESERRKILREVASQVVAHAEGQARAPPVPQDEPTVGDVHADRLEAAGPEADADWGEALDAIPLPSGLRPTGTTQEVMDVDVVVEVPRAGLGSGFEGLDGPSAVDLNFSSPVSDRGRFAVEPDLSEGLGPVTREPVPPVQVVPVEAEPVRESTPVPEPARVDVDAIVAEVTQKLLPEVEAQVRRQVRDIMDPFIDGTNRMVDAIMDAMEGKAPEEGETQTDFGLRGQIEALATRVSGLRVTLDAAFGSHHAGANATRTINNQVAKSTVFDLILSEDSGNNSTVISDGQEVPVRGKAKEMIRDFGAPLVNSVVESMTPDRVRDELIADSNLSAEDLASAGMQAQIDGRVELAMLRLASCRDELSTQRKGDY
ncbi:MAG: hypothetical protein ABID61_04025 [Candidatus Micrarchaeota archaeon]